MSFYGLVSVNKGGTIINKMLNQVNFSFIVYF